jgi:NitT/TauT family transport system permease protein
MYEGSMGFNARSAYQLVLSNWRKVALGLTSTAVFLIIWWFYAAWLRADWPFHGTPSGAWEYVPYPSEVLDAFYLSFWSHPVSGLYMGEHIYASLKRFFMGFILAFALAVPVGLLMGRLWTADAAGKPIVELFRPIPPIAWIPIFLVVFGIFWGPIAIVFLGIFFPILLNIQFGARSVDPTLIDAARTLGARRLDIFLKVVLPFTVPYLMTGVTVGLGIGWMCIVAAEMLGAVGGGVGYFIFATAGNSQFPYTYAGMLMIGILSILTTGVAGLVERRVSKWVGMR